MSENVIIAEKSFAGGGKNEMSEKLVTWSLLLFLRSCHFSKVFFGSFFVFPFPVVIEACFCPAGV
jgi:hypothetical protein